MVFLFLQSILGYQNSPEIFRLYPQPTLARPYRIEMLALRVVFAGHLKTMSKLGFERVQYILCKFIEIFLNFDSQISVEWRDSN